MTIKQAMTIAAVFASYGVIGAASSAGPADALRAEAKVTEAAARSVALSRVPGGKVQSSELERENGRLVWSFDIQQSTSPNVVEILVDAKSGVVVSKKRETPAEQAKEAKADRAKETKTDRARP